MDKWEDDLKREMKNPLFAIRFYWERIKLVSGIWLWKVSQGLMGVDQGNNVIEEYIYKMYSPSAAPKLMRWVEDNLTSDQIETLKETVKEINRIRKEKGYE